MEGKAENRVARQQNQISLTSQSGPGPAKQSPLVPWVTHWTVYIRVKSEPPVAPRGWRRGREMQDQGTWEGSTGTYLKADGPVPVCIEGVEEEVRVGGGIWGDQEQGWECRGRLSPYPKHPQHIPAESWAGVPPLPAGWRQHRARDAGEGVCG